MSIHLKQGVDSRWIASNDEFDLVETSSGWARTLAEHPDKATCLEMAEARTRAVDDGTFDDADTHVLRYTDSTAGTQAASRPKEEKP